MEEKNKKSKIGIIIAVLALVVVLLVSFTYAYFTSRNTSAEQTITSGSLIISFADENLNTVNLTDITPIYDSEIKEKASKISFTINNTGTNKAYVDINLKEINMDPELSNLEFKWALYEEDTKINNGNFRNVLDNKQLLINNIELASTGSSSYDLYIWVSESDLDQSEMMNKTFSAKVEIVGNQNRGSELLSKVIKDNNDNEDGTFNTVEDFSVMATTDEGLNVGVDDDGETYYFRGNVNDNYVKIEGLKWTNEYTIYKIGKEDSENGILYTTDTDTDECYFEYEGYGYNSIDECISSKTPAFGHTTGEDMLFRIVRINGDGTIRLIADGYTGQSKFNASDEEAKYIGYTYDNSESNVQDGTNSTIKTNIEDWYTQNLTISGGADKEYSSLLANTRYCNDTTTINGGSTINYYGPAYRIANIENITDGINPQFICPNTDKTYGGEYDLKVGLITADEISYAGGIFDNGNKVNKNYYLYGITGESMNTMSPYWNNNNALHYIIQSSLSGSMYVSIANMQTNIVPVLNLRADTLYESGNGQKDTPYIISVK